MSVLETRLFGWIIVDESHVHSCRVSGFTLESKALIKWNKGVATIQGKFVAMSLVGQFHYARHQKFAKVLASVLFVHHDIF